MIALLARAAAFVGIPAPLVYLAVYGLIAAAIGSSYWYVYAKGAGHARAECRTAELERVIYAQSQSLMRVNVMLAESTAQREEEKIAARDREEVLKMLAKELQDNAAQSDQATAEVEAELHAAITDKGKANALIAKMRATRDSCAVSDRDIDVDQRMRKQHKKADPH